MPRTRTPRKAPTKRAPRKQPVTRYTVQDVPWSQDMLDAEEVFRQIYLRGAAFDTETTGTGPQDQIWELSVQRVCDGQELFYAKCKPTVPFHPDLTDPRGRFRFDPASLQNEPSWAEIEPALRQALGSYQLVCWAADIPYEPVFDRRMIDQTRQAFGYGPLDPGDFPVFNIKPLHYALREPIYKQLGGKFGLAKALKLEGLEFTGQEHTARVDTRGIVDLVQRVMYTRGERLSAENEFMREADRALFLKARAKNRSQTRNDNGTYTDGTHYCPHCGVTDCYRAKGAH